MLVTKERYARGHSEPTAGGWKDSLLVHHGRPVLLADAGQQTRCDKAFRLSQFLIHSLLRVIRKINPLSIQIPIPRLSHPYTTKARQIYSIVTSPSPSSSSSSFVPLVSSCA